MQNIQLKDRIFSYIVFGVLGIWAWTLLQMAKQFPSLFKAETYKFVTTQWIIFIIAIPLLLLVAKSKSLRLKFVEENRNGLILASIFFSIYFLFVSIFNQPDFDVDDIFFDADTLLWRRRFTTEFVHDYYFRSVHPFVLIIIRPLIWVFSIFSKGNTLYAAFNLVALAGALCVFLAWYFVKETTKNYLYALLIASLYGTSTTQLVFSSIIETYIFLGLTAILFLVFLVQEKPSFVLIITGLVAFGITVSNFAQTVIAHFVIKRDYKQLIRYGLYALALIIPLTLLNNLIYPNSQPYFWDTKTFQNEEENSFRPTLQRANYLGRVMIFHSVVAPQPLILNEEIPFLKVWMSRAPSDTEPMKIAQYETTLSNLLAYTWLGLILLGGFLFLKNFRQQDNRFSLTFILILLFNFVLHLQYGKDVFLYSTNWTYALILFLAFAWKELADKCWFQISLLIFIALLLVNNSQLILTMLSTSAQHIQ